MSTRCIIEMEPYIRTMYQDQVKVCHICRNIVFQVQSLLYHHTYCSNIILELFRCDLKPLVCFSFCSVQCQICENPTCGIKIHNPCVARYFKGRTEPKCPECDDFWPHEIPGMCMFECVCILAQVL